MNRRSLKLWSMLTMAVVLLTASCERRPLEVLVDNAVRVRVVVKWKVNFVAVYNEEHPTGMTVRIWDSSDKVVFEESTNNDYIYASLVPGTYRMMIYNETAGDYAEGGMSFFDYNDYDKMTLRSNQYTRASGRLAAGLIHIMAPASPRIGVALDTIEVTPNMVMQDTLIFMNFEDYKANGYQSTHEYEKLFEVAEEPWPMTIDMHIKLRVKHHRSLRSVECSLSGMADGFYLSRIVRTRETGSLWFSPDYTLWKREPYGDDADETEMVYTQVASFGLPEGKELLSERNEDDNVLSLRLTLTDGSQYDLSYNVGKVIEYVTPESKERRIRTWQDLQDLQLVIDLPDLIDLPIVNPEGSGAGFDAYVDDWDDGGAFNFTGF